MSSVVQLVHRVFEYYTAEKRDMPWRASGPNGLFDPYKILVSEIMLQQTQVDRVKPKYESFIARFPDIETLAKSSFQEVLLLWSGLGYNRRAKYIHDFARLMSGKKLPSSLKELTQFKGIGSNTASAVLVYSYNHPKIFIETNIRTVYLHHVFTDREDVNDKEILVKLSESLAIVAKEYDGNYREFYWALMDYGTYLKKQGIRNTRSSHYTKQSQFEGSFRQLRGRILRLLTTEKIIKVDTLSQQLQDARLQIALQELNREKLITIDNDVVQLTP